MSDEGHEQVATEEVLELPATLENLGAKMDFVIQHVLVVERLCTRAAMAAEISSKAAIEAKAAAIDARVSSSHAADHALESLQSREPLSRKERFGTVFAGAVAGGALAWAVIAFLAVSSGAVAISSCGAH